MEFPDINCEYTRNQYGKIFVDIIYKLINYAAKNVGDAHCAKTILNLKSLIHKGGIVMTDMQLLERIGSELAKFQIPITTYDETFFHHMNLNNLFPTINTNEIDKLRNVFYNTTNEEIRVNILDAFNALLTVYYRYSVAN